MKDILGTHFEIVKTDILNYLSTNNDYFTDMRILKALKIQSIDDSDNQLSHRQRKALRQQILESEERYDLKWLSVLLIDLIGEDYQEIAYTFRKINYDKLSSEIVDKLDLLRRVTRLVYLYDDRIVDALEHLIQHPSSDSIATSEILWEQYHFYDLDEKDYDLLIEMATIIIKKLPTDYTTYFFLGYILVEQGDNFPKALEAYSKALELCQSNPTLYEQLSWLYMRISDCLFNLKRHQEVIESTNQALLYYNKYNLGHESEMEFLHFIFKTRCRAYYLLGLYHKSLDDAIKALEYCPQENREAMLGLKEKIEKQAYK